MQSTIVMINLAGAVALLLFGLAQVKQGVSRAFGAQLRTGLAAGTNGSGRSFLSGLTATIALQSSTATALMVSSFVERGLVRPRMAQIVLLGANVGTAVTAWIVAAGIVWLSPLLILSGVVLQRGQGTARQGAGVALTGIGLMLLSLHLMSTATEPLRASPALAAFIGLLDDAWPVALIIAATLAFVASSSLAIVVLVLSIAGTGVLSPGLVVALVLGANLGGAIPPVVASLGAGAAARRVVLGNLAVRAAGCLLALPIADQAGALLALLPLPLDKLPVDAHLAFNLVLAALAWPFAGFVSDAMRRLVPDGPKTGTVPKFLDPTELSTPLVALTSATREVLGVGDLIERMLVQVLDAFRRRDLSPLQDIPTLERGVDSLQQEVKLYLSKLGQDGANAADSAKAMVIVDYAINLEHIGDIIEKGLLEQVSKIVTNGLRFSDAGYRELDKLFELTIENLRIAQTIFVTRDMTLARRLMSIKVEVRVLERQSAERHLQRLREGHAASLQTSSLHLDILRDLKRINAHIVSVAHPIMDEKGLLAESRVLDFATE